MGNVAFSTHPFVVFAKRTTMVPTRFAQMLPLASSQRFCKKHTQSAMSIPATVFTLLKPVSFMRLGCPDSFTL